MTAIFESRHNCVRADTTLLIYVLPSRCAGKYIVSNGGG